MRPKGKQTYGPASPAVGPWERQLKAETGQGAKKMLTPTQISSLVVPLGILAAQGVVIVAALWLRSILRRALAIYREPTAMAPVAILSLICLTYAAAATVVFMPLFIEFRTYVRQPDEVLAFGATAVLLLYIPLAALVNFILLIIHVTIVRAVGSWELFVDPQEDEEAF